MAPLSVERSPPIACGGPIAWIMRLDQCFDGAWGQNPAQEFVMDRTLLRNLGHLGSGYAERGKWAGTGHRDGSPTDGG